jgi:hypothetical protein
MANNNPMLQKLATANENTWMRLGKKSHLGGNFFHFGELLKLFEHSMRSTCIAKMQQYVLRSSKILLERAY